VIQRGEKDIGCSMLTGAKIVLPMYSSSLVDPTGERLFAGAFFSEYKNLTDPTHA